MSFTKRFEGAAGLGWAYRIRARGGAVEEAGIVATGATWSVIPLDGSGGSLGVIGD